MAKGRASKRHASWAPREHMGKRSKRLWLRTNRGSDRRHMAQFEIGRPVYPRYAVFHKGGTYVAKMPGSGTRAARRNVMFGRKSVGNGRR